MTKRLKRLYYISGILTLATVLILVIFSTSKFITDSQEHCINIIVGIKNDKRNHEIFFPSRKYQTVILTDNGKQDSLKLIHIEKKAKELHSNKNDSIGIKVVLSKVIKYKTYIKLFNSCIKSGISDWIPLGDTIFIFHKNNPAYFNNDLCQNSITESLGVLPIEDIISDKEKPETTIIQRIMNEKERMKFIIPFAFLIGLFGYQIIKD